MPFKNPHPLYSVWQSMRRRCLAPSFKQWKDYGGRGITICPEWDSFEVFARDMGECPEGYSIDRINNDGPYSPTNCRWSSRAAQQMNRRNTIVVEIGGLHYIAHSLSILSGLKTETIVSRAAAGLPYAEVMSSKRRQSTDVAAAIAAHRASAAAKTHCASGHEFTAENTYLTKEGWKRCRICHNAKIRRYTAIKRAQNIVS